MKKFIFYFLFSGSLFLNIVWIVYAYEQKKHTDEFFSLFKVKNISYERGFLDFKEKTNRLVNKPFHLIHIWDTVGLEFNTKIPYITQLNSHFNVHNFKQIDCILISSMSDKTIKTCINSRGLKLNDLLIINDMEDYISGVCTKKGRKSKPSAATLLINNRGDIIYYNDKITIPLDRDTVLLNTLSSLNK
jgi:hypothetical protein